MTLYFSGEVSRRKQLLVRSKKMANALPRFCAGHSPPEIGGARFNHSVTSDLSQPLYPIAGCEEIIVSCCATSIQPSLRAARKAAKDTDG
jgi:hypothetical protein